MIPRRKRLLAEALTRWSSSPDGTVWTWGSNSQGQLGDGTYGFTPRTTPAQVSGLTNVVAVAAGTDFTLALRSDGSVWAWGNNASGQLGDGTTATRQTSPVAVTGLANVSAIAAGSAHAVALTSSGAVWTWGSNSSGQLGDPSVTVKSTVPLVVNTGWTATAIGAGRVHTLAVRNDGTLWGWGENGDGQLGDGSTNERSTPVQSTGVTNATSVAGGYCHSAVLKSNQTVQTTGCNAWGQLGDDTTTPRLTMAAVPGLSGVTRLSAGEYFTSTSRAAVRSGPGA